MTNQMINRINPNLPITPPTTQGTSSAGTSQTSFADVLKNSIDEVAKLQNDASEAVQNVITGKSDDVTGVMMAMEKSELAFKTLLSIRGKLMDAYEEIKNMPI